MSKSGPHPLLVGEIFVDFTVTPLGSENKLRLGGIVHAARGFWALGIRFSVAAILPDYLSELARAYLQALGCVDFNVVGYVRGAPNVTVIFDPTEVADQEYETLLRDDKSVKMEPADFSGATYEDVLIFPGTYDLTALCAKLPRTARLHLDIAYDVGGPDSLSMVRQPIDTIFMSTSSPLFRQHSEEGFASIARAFGAYAFATFILKENRGGARMIVGGSKEVEALPAQLGITTNSVGVGDVFAAAYLAHAENGRIEAAWRATYAAAAYSQTTDPDLFRSYVQRDLKLALEDMRQMWGTFLPWEKRRDYPIYLAAPDFTYADRRAIDKAIASLKYHNFIVRRPVVENGELPPGASLINITQAYRADYELLKACSLVFAVPTGRDPGALVEVGIAIESGVPVIVYDPARENENTMVVSGAAHYSDNLDACLNAVFQALSSGPPQ